MGERTMVNALALRTEYRLQQWAKFAEECSKSGMSKRDFCIKRGVSEKTYYYWLRRLREAAADSMMPQLVEVKLSHTVKQTGILSMRYNDAELTITTETPAELLTTALQALKKL